MKNYFQTFSGQSFLGFFTQRKNKFFLSLTSFTPSTKTFLSAFEYFFIPVLKICFYSILNIFFVFDFRLNYLTYFSVDFYFKSVHLTEFCCWLINTLFEVGWYVSDKTTFYLRLQIQTGEYSSCKKHHKELERTNVDNAQLIEQSSLLWI